MQGRNVESWLGVMEDVKKLKEENEKLKLENEQLKERLRISEAYRFCTDRTKIIVN